MDISKLILTDAGLNAIDNGVWVDDVPGYPGVSVLVTGLSSESAQANLKTKKAAIRLSNGGKPLTIEQESSAAREMMAESVLKGWKGITDGGVDVEYTPELAREWMTSRKGDVFANLVLLAAQKVDSNANELVKVLTKN